jgi:hypothetical protein
VVVVAGGNTADGVTAAVELYSPDLDRFVPVGTLSHPRADFAMAVLSHWQILFAGGTDGESALDSVEIYDFQANSIRIAGMLKQPRRGLAAAVLNDGTVLFSGGCGANGGLLASTEIFDPASGASAAGPDLIEARANHGSYTLPANGAVLLAGGSGDAGYLSSTELYTPWDGKIAAGSAMNFARVAHTSAVLRPGALAVAGGRNASGLLASAEIYQYATIQTDKNDYSPGMSVKMTGTGWAPGERVTAQVVALPLDSHRLEFTGSGIADGQGNVTITGFTVDQSHQGMKFLLTATGSQSQAQWAFTDAGTKISVTAIQPQSPQSYGTPVEFQGTVTDASNNPLSGSVSFTINGVTNAGTQPLGSGSGPGTFDFTFDSSTAFLPVLNPPGHHANVITITYSGDNTSITENYTMSPLDVTTNFSLTICVPSTSTCVTGTTAAIPPGVPVTIEADASPVPNVGAITGCVSLLIHGSNYNGSGTPAGPHVLWNNGAQTSSCQFPTSEPGSFTPPSCPQGKSCYIFNVPEGLSADANQTVTVQYTPAFVTGQTNYQASPITVGYAVLQATTTSVSVAPLAGAGQVYFGAPVQYTATVSAGTNTTQGTVTFFDNGSPIGTANTSSSPPLNTAVFTPASPPLGSSHSITAQFNGDSRDAASLNPSSAVSYTVVAAPVTISLATNPANTTAAVYGQPITLVGTATGAGGGAATGALQFTDNSAASGSPVTLASGQASYTNNLYSVGSHQLAAQYTSTDPGFIAPSPNTSNILTLNVTKASANLALGSTYNGTTYTFTGTLTAAAPTSSNVIPTGTVTFTDATTNTLLGQAAVNASGVATLPNITLSGTGNHAISATYSGDGNFNSANTSGSLNVNQPPVNVTVTETVPAAATFGQTVTVSATVATNPSSSQIPTGTITFIDNSNTTIGGGAVQVNPGTGTASVTFAPAGGSHSIVASYSSNSANFQSTANSAASTLTVSQLAVPVTVSSPNVILASSVPVGGEVDLLATFTTSASPGPTGSVTFVDQASGAALCTGVISNGAAACSFIASSSTLAVGTTRHVIVAYAGDSNYKLGPVSQFTFTFAKAITTTVVQASINPATIGQQVTLVATVTPQNNNVTAGGTVAFTASLNGNNAPLAGCSAAAVNNNIATCSATFNTAGSYSITASYSGDANTGASTTSANLTVSQFSNDLNISQAPASTVYGQPVTLTVSIPQAQGVPAATGTVTFTFNSQSFQRTLSGGQTTITTPSSGVPALPAGSNSVTASYSGDANYAATITPPVALVLVGKANTTTSIVTAVTGTTITLTANVTPVAPGAGTPTGAVQFFDGSTPVGTANLTASGGGATASITIPITGGNFTASYGGDSNFNASSSAQKFSPFPSALSIVSTPNPAVLGQTIQVAATITPQGSTTTPTGTVSFTANGNAISGCSAVPVTAGTAICTTSFLTKGAIPLAASYSGDSSTLASSGTSSITVNQATSSIGLVVSPSAPAFGAPFVITASIPRSPGLPAASGQVTFIYNGQTYNVPLNSSGQAALTVPSTGLPAPGPGSYVFTATYPGDTNYTSGISSINVTVAKASTTTTGTAQSNPSMLNMVVTPVAPSTGVPTGTVQFLNGTTVVGTVTLSNGRASVQIPNTAAIYTVVYSGDANFGASTGSVTYTPPGFNDNVTISASTNTPQANQTVTFTVNINGVATGTISNAPAPAGTVTFTDNGKVIGTANVVGGVATFNYPVPPGTHAIEASYGGDGIYPAGGAVMGITTTRANTTVNVSTNPPNAVAGWAVTITTQVTSTVQGLPAPTGTVQFLVGNSVVGTATLTNGAASFTLSSIPDGTRSITVNYLGDYNYAPSMTTIPVNGTAVGTLPTTTSLTGSTSNGQTTYTATVSPVAPATGTPTGTLNFIDVVTGAVIGTATLTGGTASITVSTTTDPVKALYPGDATFAGSTSNVFPGISETNGASYALTFAPDEIAVIFGSNFATGITTASLPLPTTLAGASVTVTDSAGAVRQASLFYVTPKQIAFLIPAGTALGRATVTLTVGGITYTSAITVTNVAAGLFTANANGQGVAAAQVVHVHADGTQDPPVFTAAPGSEGGFVPVPISFTPSTDTLYLVLYATGIRHGSTVTVTINGQTFTPAYSGAQGSFAGLDQINVKLPSSLAGAGQVNVTLAVDGQTSNTATLTFQ